MVLHCAHAVDHHRFFYAQIDCNFSTQLNLSLVNVMYTLNI